LEATFVKTVYLFRDFDYHPHPRRTVRFHAGITYARVLELAAIEIERAGAGRIIAPCAAGSYLTRDARHAFPDPLRNRRNKPWLI
jgi:hypothetical protein